ncbi:TetR/AcrR family transcriptional regulator [Clostridium sp. KNHs214]|uniref:TetR/AcrR family transcriptional regulator n=1 Tax=Clostridium sp. KNHs214 TaxID=1540257 RepID=UPI0005528F9B|nr:TetR/AcrR family transcriptional regulator [Clostridium sp. KNHs214]
MARIIKNLREVILDKASNILYNEGYSKLSIRRVAKECDIAVGTIYNYFPTKKDLVVEMMTNFWKEYFFDIGTILESQDEFYEKLRSIFNSLSKFIKRFKDVWLKSEIYSTPDYIESGLKRENIYIDKLILIIEELLKEKLNNHIIYSNEALEQLDTKKIASFIVMNFITMVQMPQFQYEFFESILKKLLK